MRPCSALVLVCAMPFAWGQADVPVFERAMPTDPIEQKKYFEELQRAMQAVEAASQEEAARARKAAAAPRPRSVDLAIPERDDEEIELATRRVLNESAVLQDITDLLKQLREGLDPEEIEDADRWIQRYPDTPAALASAAALAWVDGAPGAALLLAAEAAHRAPNDANTLNTLGSLLADAGYSARGIPILRYLAEKYPQQPTVQNNLGQAWLALGETEKAEFHFAACLRLAPTHGPAHAGLGVLTYCAGNHAAAARHFQTAAASHGSPLARRVLRRLDEPHATPRSFRRLAPVREYFNPRQFVIPEAQTSMAAAETKRAEVAAFVAFVGSQRQIAEQRLREAGEAVARNFSAAHSAYGATLVPPGAALASEWATISNAGENRVRRAAQFPQELEAFMAEAKQLWSVAEAKVAALRAEFEERWKHADIGEGGSDNNAMRAAEEKLCADCRAVMDAALPAIGRLYHDFVFTVYTRERVAVNEDLSYLPLITSGDLYHQEFYSIVLTHLVRVAQLAQANPIRTYECGPSPLAGAFDPAQGQVPTPGGCPIKLSASFAGVKLKGDCRSVELGFEAGLKFKAKKDFQSGETTLKGGVGVDMDLGGVGQVEGSGAFVMVWDRSNHVSFIGVESGGSASIAGIPDLSGEVDAGDGVTLEGTLPTGNNAVSVSSETTLGVTLGPRGVEPTLSGTMAAEVLGRDLVKASL